MSTVHTLAAYNISPGARWSLTRSDTLACVAAGEGASCLFLLLTYIRAPEYLGIALLSAVIFPLGMIAAARVGAWLSRRFAVVGPLSKFGIVGVLNTAIDLSLLTFLVLVTGVPRGPLYALFKATSFLAAASNSYLWNRHWSFAPTRAAGTGRPVLEAREFVRFLLLTAVGLGMSTTVATILVEIYQPLPPSTAAVWATGAGAIASVASAVWDFCAYRYLVFKWAVPIGRPLPSHRNSTIELAS